MLARNRGLATAVPFVMVLGLLFAANPSAPVSTSHATGDCTPTATSFTGTGTSSLASGTYGTAGSVYAELTFTSTDSCSWSVPAGLSSLDIVLVGGGGAGGYGSRGGGGGAGEVAYMTGYAVTAGASVTIEVGNGGVSSGDGSSAANGAQTTFGSVVALGGGRGGGDAGSASTGGSSGGRIGITTDAAVAATTSSNSGFTHLANAGGHSDGTSYGTGGGGAGGPAAYVTDYGGSSAQPNGGSSITLFGAELAGGGGGWMGGLQSSSGGGSVGGDWAGGCSGAAPTANTGSGGGSCESGADGVVILRYQKINQTVSWSPATSLTLADSGVSLSATRTLGDGTLGYSVVSQGTTGCSVSGSTLTFSSTGSGSNGCEVRPTLTSTTSYNALTNAPTVTFDISQGSFAISSPSSKVGTSASSFTDVCTSSCDVSGFAAADEVLVVVNKSDGSALSGRVRLDSDTGLDDVTGYTTTPTGAAGYDEIAFVGTQAEVNAALETLQYKSPTGGGDESLGISASLSGAAYFAGTGHYYEVINVGATVNWEDARCRAKYGNSSAHDDSSGLTQSDDDCTNTSSRRTLNGLQGYLANITSLDEHNFLRTKLSDVGWIGGADVDTEGTFLWMDGPEAGETFFVAGTSSRRTTNTIDGEDQFNYFSDGEPNNSSDEDFVEFGFGSDGVGSSWNDCKNGCNRTKFVIEYGEDGDSPIKQASTTFTVGAPTAPLQVTGASATAGNNQVALSWSAPDSGGSAITDYVIEQLDSDGSTWNTLTDGVSTSTSFTVTGLTNGTSYSFRVSAKNTIGTGTVSSTVSATPAVPAPSGGGSSGGTTVTPVPVVAPTTPAVPRIITPTQPTLRPSVLSGPVSSPGRGFDPNTGTRATVGGAPATVVKRALPGGVSVQTGAFQFGVSLGGNEENTVDDGVSDLGVAGGGTAKVTGSGMLPGSPVQVWLPGPTGTEPRELARATVNEDGQVEADLAFVAKPSDTAIAIGPQVMQVTGYDDDGNLTVVDMTINVSQGPITPEPDRSEGALPALSVGSSLATSAGIPTPVTVVPLSEEKRVSIGDGSWTLLVDVDPETGVVGGTPEAPVVQVTQDSVGSASGEGFMPGTTASVWMFSDPTLLGTVTVGDDGSFTTEFQVDSTYLPAGTHTLQVQGVGDDGYIKAANLGVDVQAPADLTSTGSSGLLWWVAGIFALLLAALFLAIMRRRRGDRVPTR